MSNVPKLRFKEFSENYNKYKFEDIFSFSTGKNIKQNEASPDFEIPCVRYGELYHMYGEVITKVINKTNLDKSELRFSEGTEILLPSAGEDPLDIGSASALKIPNVAIGRTINILSPLSDNIYLPEYVSYYINQKLKKKISTLAKGVSISNVYNSDLKTLTINLPLKKEQEKIVSFLSSIDTKIEQLTKKEALLQEYKKGVMNKIFNQEIRFKDDDGKEFPEWIEKKLENILYEYNKKNLNLFPQYTIGKKGIVLLDESKHNIREHKIFRKGNFVIGIGIDEMNVNINVENGCCSPIYNIFDISELELLSIFAYFYLPQFLNKNKRMFTKKSTRREYEISKSDLLKEKIILPCLQEQTKIANFLSSIDKKIELTTKELNSTKEFKKALLQQMFV